MNGGSGGEEGHPVEGPVQHLKLYISGNTSRSSFAVHQLKAVCEKYLAGRYVLEIIDIYQDSRAARDDRIVAVPTLMKLDPDFSRRLIGDLSDVEKLKLFLGIAPGTESGP
ncbi:circadian clock KaiB family protein [Pseudomonas sp. UBA1879]|uniref:circadian clock KaiB family protein n=1 Tax=Pseudomonas sp. UBA1879 TaxID=1947305 RepID=UPI0025FB2B8E|nr:circadian clock KaiB family protein [Pseudomonas sp. UBA1879]